MDVQHIAHLANLPLTPAQAQKFASQFASTLDTIQVMSQLNTQSVSPTSQVTGLTNVTRPDQITPDRVLSQSAALANASRTHSGYFLVPAIFDSDA